METDHPVHTEVVTGLDTDAAAVAMATTDIQTAVVTVAMTTATGADMEGATAEADIRSVQPSPRSQKSLIFLIRQVGRLA